MELLESFHQTGTFFWIVFALSTIGVVAIVAHLRRWVLAQLPQPGLQARQVLTPNEQEFFGRLQRALPDYEVLAQVSMAALLEPTVGEDHPRYWPLRKQFSGKICDFVVKRKGKTGPAAVVAVIELDDRTHDKEKDAKRDAMLASVGIRTVRYESTKKPSPQEIRTQIKALDAG